jgi:hypothetical protein
MEIKEKAQRELLRGAKPIARALYGSDSQPARSRVYYLQDQLPVFRMGITLCAYREDLSAFMAAKVQAARERAANYSGFPRGRVQRAGPPKREGQRLFALVCRSYLAAVMPDYEYRQTVVTMPNNAAAEFRSVGRIPLRLGWKARR